MNSFEHIPKYPVQTLGKALDILNYIKDNHSTEGISLTEISKALGIGKSGVHRLLDTLMAYDFIEKTSDSSTSYRLGWGLYHAGNAVPKQHTLSSSNYMPIMERLCKKFSETVNLGIYSNFETIIMYQMEPNRMLRTNTQIGEREPLYCTSIGKIFLSQFTYAQLESYIRDINPEKKTKNTIVSFEDLLKDISEIKDRGYAIDNEEYVDGMICMAMPIKDFSGKTVYGISVSGPAARMTEEKRNEIYPILKEACDEISEFLGYKE